jgi:hypothetical protein
MKFLNLLEKSFLSAVAGKRLVSLRDEREVYNDPLRSSLLESGRNMERRDCVESKKRGFCLGIVGYGYGWILMSISIRNS